MMDQRATLIRMLRKLNDEMNVVMSQGAGYYTCAPFAKRFNKLLEQARTLFVGDAGIISTFEPLPPADPKDPGEKSKVLLEIRIEINQLVTLLESTGGDSGP
ncbi:MAG: hypothetical protein HYS27_18995 [Deltaproteobacteria bacterium]|nr:hypothetical protein [Deltaproteobacteria bacterium]